MQVFFHKGLEEKKLFTETVNQNERLRLLSFEFIIGYKNVRFMNTF